MEVSTEPITKLTICYTEQKPPDLYFYLAVQLDLLKKSHGNKVLQPFDLEIETRMVDRFGIVYCHAQAPMFLTAHPFV